MSLSHLRHSMANMRQQSQSLFARAIQPGQIMGGDSMAGSLSSLMLMGQDKNNIDPSKHYIGWQAACIRVTAQRVATQPIVVARKISPGSTQKAATILPRAIPKNMQPRAGNLEILSEHPLITAFRKPNELHLKYDLMFVAIASLELTARCYLWVRDDGDGSPKTIWHIPSHWVSPIYGTDRIYRAWVVRPEQSTEAFVIPAEQMVYVSYPNPNSPLRPISPLQMASRPILIDEQILECQKRSFKSPNPSLAVHIAATPDQPYAKGVKPELSEDQKNRIRGMVKQMYAGSMSYDEPIILDGVIDKLEMLSKTVKEMDYNNSAKFVKDRITQLLQTNSILLGQVESANRASSLTAEQNFNSININPKIEMLSEVFSEKLAPMFAAEGEELVVWIVPAEVADREMDAKEANDMRDRGALTTDEYRLAIGIEPIGGKLGSMVMFPNTMILADIEGNKFIEEPLSPAQGGSSAAA